MERTHLCERKLIRVLLLTVPGATTVRQAGAHGCNADLVHDNEYFMVVKITNTARVDVSRNLVEDRLKNDLLVSAAFQSWQLLSHHLE